MKVSIVIPVYNEADQLSDCLNAIALQSVKPHEVIVVDNNSYDDSAVVAENYGFVKLISEEKQGVVHARTAGFNQASGDVIARIDADTVLPSNWVELVAKEFKSKEVDAVSGVALYYDVALARACNSVDLYFRRKLAKSLSDCVYLWGANMAVRRDVWDKVKSVLCYKKDLHEDYDLAIHMQDHGYRVIFSENLVASVSPRRINTGFVSFMKYVWKSPSTYKKHDKNVLGPMMPVVIACALLYLPGLILYRGYDPDNQEFSLLKLLQTKTEIARVDPTTNVV